MNVELKLGDPHNFGLQVHLVENSVPLVLFKPRSVFWEHLFLDQQSSFRKLLELKSKISFESILGHIDVTTENGYNSGTAKYYTSSDAMPDSEWFYNLGQLIAFCSTFGIVDLHKDNVLTSGKRFQIIDVECLFWNIELPSETLLLPKTNEEWSRSIFYISGLKGLGTVEPIVIESLINGLSDFFNCFSEYRQSIEDYFNSNLNLFSANKVRILLKPTQEYRSALKNKKFENNFIPEESVQLLRGDIPYFFGYLNDPNIYYYSRPNVKEKVKISNEVIQAKVTRAFQSPVSLLSSERLERIHKHSIIEISRRLLDLGMLPYLSEGMNIFIEDNYLKIVARNYALQTRV